MSKQDELRDAGDHLVDQVRALLHNVEPILVQRELGQRHPGEVSKEQGAGLDGVAEAQRLLLVVDAQVGQAFHKLGNLGVVCRALNNLAFDK